MSANVETAAYANTPAWHREGVVLDTNGEKGMTIEQAIPATGLDWLVRKVPAYAPISYKTDKDTQLLVPTASSKLVQVDGRYNVQRVSDGKFLGNVGRTWEPTQNLDGFQLVQDLIEVAGGEGTKCWIEAGGALDGGKKVWILAHLDDDMQIAGEKYDHFLLFTNGHDGRTSVTAATTTVRVVCQNTLALALDTTQRVVRVRHTKNANDRIKEAQQILGLRNQYAEKLAQQGEWLVENEMGEGDFEKFIASLMPIAEGQEEKPAGTMIRDRRTEVRNLWRTADNLAPIRDTRWGALQATIEYADYGRTFKNDASQLKSQFGLSDQATLIKNRSMQILMDPKMEAMPA